MRLDRGFGRRRGVVPEGRDGERAGGEGEHGARRRCPTKALPPARRLAGLARGRSACPVPCHRGAARRVPGVPNGRAAAARAPHLGALPARLPLARRPLRPRARVRRLLARPLRLRRPLTRLRDHCPGCGGRCGRLGRPLTRACGARHGRLLRRPLPGLPRRRRRLLGGGSLPGCWATGPVASARLAIVGPSGPRRSASSSGRCSPVGSSLTSASSAQRSRRPRDDRDRPVATATCAPSSVPRGERRTTTASPTEAAPTIRQSVATTQMRRQTTATHVTTAQSGRSDHAADGPARSGGRRSSRPATATSS
jgi:hypothetical protein